MSKFRDIVPTLNAYALVNGNAAATLDQRWRFWEQLSPPWRYARLSPDATVALWLLVVLRSKVLGQGSQDY